MSRPSFSHRVILSWSLLLLLWVSLTVSALAVTDILRIDASVDSTTLSIRDYQEARIRLRYNCASTTTNASNATIEVLLPAELEATSLTGSIHTTNTNYDSSLRQALFTFVDPLPAGSTGDVFLNVRFLQTTPENTKVSVRATFTAPNSLSQLSQQVFITGINAPSLPGFVKGMSINKSAGDSTLDANYGYMSWAVAHGNTGGIGQNISNYVIEDIFASGTMLTEFLSDYFPNTSNAVTVSYKTNLNGSYRQWGSGPLYNTGDGGQWFYPSSLGLASNEYITAMKWNYGTVPGGGKFHPDNQGGYLYYYTRIVNPANPLYAAGRTLQNCATVTGTNEATKSSCASVTMDTPAPSFTFYHYVSSPSSPYQAGSRVQYTIAFGINAQSSTAVANPSLGVLLPAELSYAGSANVFGEAFTDAGSPAPKFTQINNWKGTGRTLVRWSWSASTGNPLTIPYQRNWRNLYLSFDANIAAATTDGYYRSTAFGNWTPNGKGGSWFERDVEDWDANSNTAEMRARHDLDLQIIGLAPRYNLAHWIDSPTAPHEKGDIVRYGAQIQVNDNSALAMTDPVIGVLLPKEIQYVGNVTFTGYGYEGAGRPPAVFQQVNNFEGTGQTLVRWSWTAATGNSLVIPADGNWRPINLYFDARIANTTANGNYRSRVFGNWKPNAKGYWAFEQDRTDFDGNGNMAEQRATTETWTPVLTAGGSAGINSEMLVKGQLDATWTAFPSKGLTTPGGKADYKLTLTNPSGVIMRNLVIIDILPNLGDTGVIDLSPRGSQWAPYLAAPVAASGATVSYSLSGKPCRDELTPGIPVGCDAPNWTVTPPADITKVKSLKIDFGATKIYPGDNLVMQWPMRAPINAPTGGQVAWNSFGYIAVRDDDNSSLLASEPIKTGISIKPPDPPFYGNFVWNDANQNGLQDAGEKGINGIRVELYRAASSTPNLATDTLIGFTTTSYDGTQDGGYLFSGMGPGNYYALVIPGGDWGLSIANQGPDDAKDSDGAPTFYQGGRAALLPVTSLTNLEDDRTWDQGLIDRSGKPSVWAMVDAGNGLTLLGGRFQTSRGLSRRNIVRVSSDGSPDPTFTPGGGFDGEVRALDRLNDGRILAGGTFTMFNGNPAAFGAALLSANGTSITPLAKPDVNNVRWVGVSSSGLYIAGAFNNIGSRPAKGIARYTSSGALDTSFDTTNAANATVHAGAIQPDGKIIIGGSFTSVGGIPRSHIARLNANGSVDPTFDPGAGANGDVLSLKFLSDGRLILTGNFSSYNGQPSHGTMRLMPNGQPDPTITASTLTVETIQTSN